MFSIVGAALLKRWNMRNKKESALSFTKKRLILAHKTRWAQYDQKGKNWVGGWYRYDLYSVSYIRHSKKQISSPAGDAYEMMERIEAALGDEYKKQSMTELVVMLRYGDTDGNTVNYYILKTTYYETDPAEVTGLNMEAIMLIIDP